uniref:Variant surface glycoprotein 1716 n=1 Tax=Trypanosoma brucei TaxID=5691 RepID=M4SX26_9TRYP|nr:variant surface glycoprotein 1716 [Trypanosoma brucei]
MLTKATAALLAGVLILKAPTTAMGTKQETVATSACKAARSFEKLKAHIEEQTRTKIGCLDSYTAERRHLIAAAIGSGEAALATAAATLLVYGDTQAAQLHSQLRDLEQAANTSIALLTELAAEQLQIAAFGTVRVGTSDSGTANLQGNTPAMNVEFTAKADTRATCEKLSKEEEAAAAQWTAANNWKKLKMFTLQTASKGAQVRKPYLCVAKEGNFQTISPQVVSTGISGRNMRIIGGPVFVAEPLEVQPARKDKFVNSKKLFYEWKTATDKASHTAETIRQRQQAFKAVAPTLNIHDRYRFKDDMVLSQAFYDS